MRPSANPELVDAFATELRARRIELNLSQDDVAHQANLDRGYISRLEAGKKNPSLSVLYGLATALKLSLVELSGRVDDRYQATLRKAAQGRSSAN